MDARRPDLIQRHALLERAAVAAAHHAVAVVHAHHQLLEDPASVGLLQARGTPLAQDVLEQVAALCVLHHDGQVPGEQEHLQAHTCVLAPNQGVES